MTKEMEKIFDDYFGKLTKIDGEYPIPYQGFQGNRRITIDRTDIELLIESGALDNHPAVLDSINQLKQKGHVSSNYFPWIIQRAKEILADESKPVICKSDCGNYFYISHNNDVICDEDGNTLHFATPENAQEFIDENY